MFAAVNRFSLEIDEPAHLWSWADNKDTDQHAHSRTVILTFVVCFVISLAPHMRRLFYSLFLLHAKRNIIDDADNNNNYYYYDIAVIPWITSCYKNRITTRYIKLWREQVTS